MGCGSSLYADSTPVAQNQPADKNPSIAPVTETEEESALAQTQQSSASAESKQKIIGFHILAIRKFIKDHPQVVTEQLTTSQINRTIVKPDTLGTNEPYINKLVGVSDPDSGSALVSEATVFVSHAWRYNFYDVVVNVMEKYASTNPDAYFWFDLFTNNQNEVINKDFDWFSSTFRNSIREIGQVLLVLSPWNDPIPIRRAWCLFEIHNAIDDSEVKLSVEIPRKEVKELIMGILTDPSCVVQALSDIQAQKAQATSASDLELIFKAIRESDGGFSRVNQQIKDRLRNWYIDQLKFFTKKAPDNTLFILHSAHVMRSFGFYDEAFLHYQNALRVELDLHGESHRNVVSLYGGIASVYRYKGDFDNALENYHKSLKIEIELLGDNHPNVAATYNNMADAYIKKGEIDTALDYYQKSLQIELDTLGEGHRNVAYSYSGIAEVYSRKGDNNKCLEYYHKAIKNELGNLGENHPNLAISYNNMAIVYKRIGEYDQAMNYYTKSLTITESVLGERHPSVAISRQNIKRLQLKMANG